MIRQIFKNLISGFYFHLFSFHRNLVRVNRTQDQCDQIRRLIATLAKSSKFLAIFWEFI